MRSLLLAVILLGMSLALSGCGIINHQVHRAANLLRVPVRMTQAPLPAPVELHVASQA